MFAKFVADDLKEGIAKCTEEVNRSLGMAYAVIAEAKFLEIHAANHKAPRLPHRSATRPRHMLITMCLAPPLPPR